MFRSGHVSLLVCLDRIESIGIALARISSSPSISLLLFSIPPPPPMNFSCKNFIDEIAKNCEFKICERNDPILGGGNRIQIREGDCVTRARYIFIRTIQFA